MSNRSGDRNLLFGVFALQMDFLTRDQLVEGMQAWVLAKSRALEDILVEKGLLAAADRDLLLPLVARHVDQHGGDPEQSLKAISSVTVSVDMLKQIADSDLQHSLASLKLRRPAAESDLSATVSVKPDFGRSGTRYLSLRLHAKGGLGEVFVARDIELDREVALKEIQHHHAHDADSRSRFLIEAEITGKLEHPGIVPVYGLGHYPDGRPFYAMRFIRGDSLHRAIQDFHQTPPAGNPFESVAFRKLLGRFVDVCNAVGYAHSRGVLHRDLKPGNVMLGKHGETLVVDWGLAKVKSREESSSEGEATLQVSSGSGTDQTLPGSAIGTPGYMSPEQAEGKLRLLGPATDIYALGATLYNVLTGKKPIEGQTIHEILERTIKGEIPKPREHQPQIPKALESVCLKAMEMAPAERYATCLALADDVERFLADEPVAAYPEPFSARVRRFARKHQSAVRAAGIALVLVASIATGAAFLINEQRHRAEQLADEKSELATKEESARKDAERLAREKSDLAVKEALARKDAEQQTTNAKRQLAWNYFTHGLAEYGDGRITDGFTDIYRAWDTCPPEDPRKNSYHRVLFDRAIEQGRAIGLPVSGRDAHRVAYSPAEVHAVAYSPDGERVITTQFGMAQVWDVRTGAPVGKPIRHDEADGFVDRVELSPDGERVLTTSWPTTMARLWDARTGMRIGQPLPLESPIAVAFSPTGKQVLIEGKLWDAQTGADLEIDEPFHSVSAAAFSPDGKRIVTGSPDRNVRLWDAQTGELIGKPMEHEGGIDAVAFSPDGERILTGSYDQTARLWDAATGTLIGNPMSHANVVETVAFSPDGERVLTTSRDGAARLWNAQTGEPLGQPLPHRMSVTAAAFSPDGVWVLTGSEDKFARLWNPQTGELLSEFAVHEKAVVSVAFSAGCEFALTRCEDGPLRLWELGMRSSLGEPMRHEDYVDVVAFSPDGERVLTGSQDKTARLWDARTGHPLGPSLPHGDFSSTVKFSPDGQRVLTESRRNHTQLWDPRSGIPIGQRLSYNTDFRGAVFSPDGTRMLALSDLESARLWDARTGTPIGEPLPHLGYVSAVAFSPDGTRVLTGSRDASARLWDAETGTPIGEPLWHDDAVIAVAFSPDGTQVLTGSHDGTARLWDARTGIPLGDPMQHEYGLMDVAFSPDGERILTRTGSSEYCLWDPRTCTPVGEPFKKQRSLIRVPFSLDGGRLLTADFDNTVQLWDARTGTPIGEPMRHRKEVHAVAFSPDGERVVTGSDNNSAQLWDAWTGTPIGEPLWHNAGVLAVAFSLDGKRLITGSADYTASLWDCSIPNYPDDPEMVKLCVEIMAGLALPPDSIAQPAPLTHEELIARWQTLERGAEAFLDQLRQRSIRRGMERHRHAAREAENVRRWFVAEFHLRHLLQAEPENQELKSRHEWAVRELERSKAAAKSLENSPSVLKPAIAEKPQ